MTRQTGAKKALKVRVEVITVAAPAPVLREYVNRQKSTQEVTETREKQAPKHLLCD